VGTVYLIHFQQALHHAKHYVGFTAASSPLPRLQEHRTNRGARLLMVLNTLGIPYHVVRIWRFKTRKDERALKSKKHISRLCPYCNKRHKKSTYTHHKK
jgi:hypothetical protein